MSFKKIITTALVFMMAASSNNFKAQDDSAGFVIEIVDTDSASQNIKNSVAIDYIKSLTPDTIIVKDKNGNPVSWVGVPLLTVIEERTGINLSRIEKLFTNAPDGYNSVISDELLPELKSAYLVYDLADSNKWLKKYGQVRLIYPNLREMYYVSNPEKIIIYIYSEKISTGNQQFYFLGRGPLSGFSSNDSETQKGIKIDDVLSALKLTGRNFTLLTTDSLQREYLYNDVIQLMVLKIEDKGTWKITGKKVPVGLRTRKIFYLQSEGVGIFLKSLSDEEIVLWENYVSDRFLESSNFSIELVLTGDERIPVEHNKEAGIYKSISNVIDQESETTYFEVIRNN
jgi:hypothetical protein